MLKLIATALMAFGMLAAPVLAQEAAAEDEFVMPAWKGVAIAQAAEAGLGICIGPDSATTISCAQDMCMKESGLGLADCTAQLWCSPHAWTADIFMQHQEGISWHDFVCGENTRESLDRLIAASCAEDYLVECTAVRIWDPDGNEVIGQVDASLVTVLE